MPDDAAPTAATGPGLDDLERRLAAFEASTRRLGHTVGTLDDPGFASPPRPATRRLSEAGAPRGEEISGLRPAVQQPVTGALTARSRPPGSPAGFTSVHGRPRIPTPAPAQSAPIAERQSTSSRVAGTRMLAVAIVLIAVALLGAVALRSTFVRLPDATLVAFASPLAAPAAGSITGLSAQVGQRIVAGQTIAAVGEVAVTAARDGVVSRLLTGNGDIVVAGEFILELSHPESLRAVVEIPQERRIAASERVLLELLGDNQTCGGMVESVQPPGTAVLGLPPASRDRAVIILDPLANPPRAGQLVRVFPLGSAQPSAVRQLLFAARRLLP